MFSHLSGWRVNLALLQEAASKELLGILDKCDGPKVIVWDDSLAGPVGLIAQYVHLKERNNVETMLPLRSGALLNVDVKHVIFITRPTLKLMDYIAENIHSEEKKRKYGPKKEYHLFFSPKVSILCEKRLQIKGVYGSFTNVGEFKCDFFPVDNDLVSLELPDAYRELHLEGDPTCLHLSASALVTLQKFYGRIPRIYGKGNYAQKVWELTKMMGKDEPAMLNSTDKGAIDQLIIFDRSIDLMSPLATQLTYEGLIDESYGINHNTVNIPSDGFTKSEDQINTPMTSTSETVKIVLNSGDDLYRELRDKNFSAVGQILSRHANSIRSQMDERYGDKTIQEMKLFVDRLPNMMANKKSLANHTSIAELIKAATDSYDFVDELECEQNFLECSDIDKPHVFIEDLIAKKAPFKTVIRLMCIQCIAGSGLKPKVLDYYKRELVQVYGIEVLLTLGNLEKAGLLMAQKGSRTYAMLRKTLNLTVDDVNEVAPKDISYVHTIYAPLTIRIIEQSLKYLGWQSLNDILTSLPGATFDDYQMATHAAGAGSAGTILGRRGSLTSELSQSDVPRVILVFFLGGCTFAEIAALRFLAQQDVSNVEFIIATTKIINKNSFLEGFFEHNTDI